MLTKVEYEDGMEPKTTGSGFENVSYIEWKAAKCKFSVDWEFCAQGDRMPSRSKSANQPSRNNLTDEVFTSD